MGFDCNAGESHGSYSPRFPSVRRDPSPPVKKEKNLTGAKRVFRFRKVTCIIKGDEYCTMD